MTRTITHLGHFNQCFLNICEDFNKIIEVQKILTTSDNTDGAIIELIITYHEEHLIYPQRAKT